MGAKKKKKGGKKKKSKKEKNDDEEEKQEDPILPIELQHYGWIRVEFQLCNPIPCKVDPDKIKTKKKNWNTFVEIMRADERVLELKKRIVDYHGRVDNVALYNYDPIPPRNKDTGMPSAKNPNIPPFRGIEILAQLKEERDDIRKKEEEKAKKKKDDEEKGIAQQRANYDPDDPDSQNITSIKEISSDDPKFKVLDMYDFKETVKSRPNAKDYIVRYEEADIPLWEIFGSYGTKRRPKKVDDEEELRLIKEKQERMKAQLLK